MSIGLARVTINAPHRRVDVALPEHLPLAELLPEVLRHAGEGLADDGEKHAGWVLRRTDGVALATTQGLFPQGVRDGAVLHLVPAHDDWPELEYDDVVEAIAAGARRRGGVWLPRSTRTASLAAAGVLLALGLGAVLAAGPTWPAAAFAGLGVLAPLSWLGDSELLAGSVALLLVAALGGVGVAGSLRLFTAGAVVGLFGALTALTGMVASAAGAAAALVSVLVCGLGALPLLAIRFGRMPTPPVSLPTGVDASAGFSEAGVAGALPDGMLDQLAPDYPARIDTEHLVESV